MPRGRATGQARTARAVSESASMESASTGPAAVRPTPGSAPWRLLRRLPLLALTVVVSVTVLGLQLADVTAAASWLASIFALGVAVYLAVGMIRDIRRGHFGDRVLVTGEHEPPVERERAADRGEDREPDDDGDRVEPGGDQR